MDYIFEDIFTKGFKPETRKENYIIDQLKHKGFVYFKKETNSYFAKTGVVKSETPDEITLKVIPVINYVGLFVESDNFTPSLDINVKNKHIMIQYFKDMTEQEKKNIVKGLPLGKRFSIKIAGYGKSKDNEGYMVELGDEEVLQNLFRRPRRNAFFTTGLSKFGKERDTENLDFVSVRPATLMFKLGISTTFGVFYSLEDYENSGNVITFDKATLK